MTPEEESAALNVEIAALRAQVRTLPAEVQELVVHLATPRARICSQIPSARHSHHLLALCYTHHVHGVAHPLDKGTAASRSCPQGMGVETFFQKPIICRHKMS